MAIYFDNSNITTGSKGEAGYTPVRGTDYWTDTDIAEIKGYVDEAASEALDTLSIDGNTTTTLNGLFKGNGSTLQVATAGTDYANPARSVTVTLTAAGWANNTQTVSVEGATTTNVKVLSPAPASIDEYASCGVKAAAEGAGTITFICTTIPENGLTVNIAILG